MIWLRSAIQLLKPLEGNLVERRNAAEGGSAVEPGQDREDRLFQYGERHRGAHHFVGTGGSDDHDNHRSGAAGIRRIT